MIRYRPHIGSLSDSMREAKTFVNISDMLKHIEMYWLGYVDMRDIVISESYGEDRRIGWKSWRYVCTKRYGNEIYENPQCIGMCDLGERG